MEIAFQKYLDSYIRICPNLTPEELGFIHSNLTITRYNKKEIYLKSNDVQHEMGFVYQGLLKSYYIDDKGKKVTISFISEDSYASDYPSFIRQRPSKYFLECLEPTIMVNLSYKKIQEAYRTFKNFENYGRLVAEQILLKKQDRIESFLFENAEQRYLKFVSDNKNIINRISLTDLSSYLGIERQSLSRIRKNILEN